MSDLDMKKIEKEFRELDPDLSEENRNTMYLHSSNETKDDEKDDEYEGNDNGKDRRLCYYPYRFVPLSMGGSNGRTHVVTDESCSLMEEVSLVDLERMTTKFYENVFQDATLDNFIHSHNDPHASRSTKLIHQKLSGSTVWDDDRYHHRDKTPKVVAGGRHRVVVHDRSSAHVAAWYSSKRPAQEVGRHFQLDECRVWMRLHFWALRHSGIMDQSPSFADYYIRFIAHFVRVYESTAPFFARESFRWSSNPKNIQTYIHTNGRRMNDILGLTLGGAIHQIPESKAQDVSFPYHTHQEKSVTAQ